MTYVYIDQQAPDSIIDTDRVYPVGIWKDYGGALGGITFDPLPSCEEISSPEEAQEMISYLNGGETPTRFKNINFLLIVRPNSLPRITGPWSDIKICDKAKDAYQGHNRDLPIHSMHRTGVFHIQWKRHHFPRIKRFMPYELGEQV